MPTKRSHGWSPGGKRAQRRQQEGRDGLAGLALVWEWARSSLRSQTAILNKGGSYRSERAVRVNIEIMRAFVRLRQLLSSHADLAGSSKRWRRNATLNSRWY